MLETVFIISFTKTGLALTCDQPRQAQIRVARRNRDI